MIFGRGGSGGVINRVTKQADWDEHREISAQVGSYGRSRSAVDIGRAINSNAAFRVTAMYEDSDSYRDGVSVERYGINPTASFRLGARRSDEHTSEPPSLMRISYSVFCLKKKT